MRADSIASHGRTGLVSALSVGTLGRLLYITGIIPPIIIEGIVEIWNLVSAINRQLDLESKLWLAP